MIILAMDLRPKHLGKWVYIKGSRRRPGISGRLQKFTHKWPMYTLTIDDIDRKMIFYKAIEMHDEQPTAAR